MGGRGGERDARSPVAGHPHGPHQRRAATRTPGAQSSRSRAGGRTSGSGSIRHERRSPGHRHRPVRSLIQHAEHPRSAGRAQIRHLGTGQSHGLPDDLPARCSGSPDAGLPPLRAQVLRGIPHLTANRGPQERSKRRSDLKPKRDGSLLRIRDGLGRPGPGRRPRRRRRTGRRPRQ